jgi:hypothetical protein
MQRSHSQSSNSAARRSRRRYPRGHLCRSYKTLIKICRYSFRESANAQQRGRRERPHELLAQQRQRQDLSDGRIWTRILGISHEAEIIGELPKHPPNPSTAFELRGAGLRSNRGRMEPSSAAPKIRRPTLDGVTSCRPGGRLTDCHESSGFIQGNFRTSLGKFLTSQFFQHGPHGDWALFTDNRQPIGRLASQPRHPVNENYKSRNRPHRRSA